MSRKGSKRNNIQNCVRLFTSLKVKYLGVLGSFLFAMNTRHIMNPATTNILFDSKEIQSTFT